jgi:hypothetical protein
LEYFSFLRNVSSGIGELINGTTLKKEEISMTALIVESNLCKIEVPNSVYLKRLPHTRLRRGLHVIHDGAELERESLIDVSDPQQLKGVETNLRSFYLYLMLDKIKSYFQLPAPPLFVWNKHTGVNNFAVDSEDPASELACVFMVAYNIVENKAENRAFNRKFASFHMERQDGALVLDLSQTALHRLHVERLEKTSDSGGKSLGLGKIFDGIDVSYSLSIDAKKRSLVRWFEMSAASATGEDRRIKIEALNNLRYYNCYRLFS